LSHILNVLQDRALLCEGGMGCRVQALDLDIERGEYEAAIGVR
jgi:5-methyltetrahydrofolate--homocysteine methyltransferase